jgi:hypothetical protein
MLRILDGPKAYSIMNSLLLHYTLKLLIICALKPKGYFGLFKDVQLLFWCQSAKKAELSGSCTTTVRTQFDVDTQFQSSIKERHAYIADCSINIFPQYRFNIRTFHQDFIKCEL